MIKGLIFFLGVFMPLHAADTLVIGSKNFTEGRVLCELIAQLIEGHTQLTVERRVNLGGTLLTFSALRNGEIDIYAEYTGTGLAVILGLEDRVRDPLESYLLVERGFQERYQIQWLQPLGFDNTYALAIREDFARKHNITRISDLRAHQDQLSAGWSSEFIEREDGYPGLAAHYDLKLASVRGMEHGLAYEALDAGKIQLIDAYSTDGKLLRFPVRVLEDDRRFFPPYNCAPIIRSETLKKHPELEDILNLLAFKIGDKDMQRLNYQVEEEGRSFEEVADAYLVEQGLLNPDNVNREWVNRKGQVWEFIVSRLPKLGEQTLQHLRLTGYAVFAAILFAVPLGILLTRRSKLAGPVIGMAGVIQTIPGLALLAFMIPIPGLGLDARSAIVALFLYALLPIIRNTYMGISQVDADLVKAARGMGLSSGEILRIVQLPLAMGSIMAGIRIAAVIAVGMATLAAFIGAGGLGDPILTGLQLNDTRLILSGALPAALLALFIDYILGRFERYLAPKGLS